MILLKFKQVRILCFALNQSKGILWRWSKSEQSWVNYCKIMTLLLMKCRGNNELLNLDPCKLFFVIVARLAIYVPQLPQGFSLLVKIFFFSPSLNESTLPDKRVVCLCLLPNTFLFAASGGTLSSSSGYAQKLHSKLMVTWALANRYRPAVFTAVLGVVYPGWLPDDQISCSLSWLWVSSALMEQITLFAFPFSF